MSKTLWPSISSKIVTLTGTAAPAVLSSCFCASDYNLICSTYQPVCLLLILYPRTRLSNLPFLQQPPDDCRRTTRIKFTCCKTKLTPFNDPSQQNFRYLLTAAQKIVPKNLKSDKVSALIVTLSYFEFYTTNFDLFTYCKYIINNSSFSTGWGNGHNVQFLRLNIVKIGPKIKCRLSLVHIFYIIKCSCLKIIHWIHSQFKIKLHMARKIPVPMITKAQMKHWNLVLCSVESKTHGDGFTLTLRKWL